MMTTEQGTPALVKKLADEIIERLDESYDLVYVDYRDQLTDTQVAKLVRGDHEWIDESFEFESDSKYESTRHIIDELRTQITDEWGAEADVDLTFLSEALVNDFPEEWDRVRFEIEDRDTGSWVEQLVGQTPSVLLRIEAIDEDHSYSFEEVSPERVLKDLGVPITDENIKTVDYVLANASPEYSVLMGYWIVGADVEDIYELGFDPKTNEWRDVEIVNPYLYLGNPFAGSGFISERPLEATVRVKREDLRTDQDAFGYAVDEVYGGLIASQFECELRAVTTDDE